MTLTDMLMMARKVQEENAFKQWYEQQRKATAVPGFMLSPNPDDPEHHYDWRGAYRAGVKPIPYGDGKFHWDSRFKTSDHPNRFVDTDDNQTEDTITGIRYRGEYR